jgi:methanogenic corrinoid protein MtbC1
MVIDRQAHLLALSVTMTFHLPHAIDLIRRIKDNTHTLGLPVLIGGGPFNRAPDLWRTVGADGFARDAGEAVEVANNMLSALTR